MGQTLKTRGACCASRTSAVSGHAVIGYGSRPSPTNVTPTKDFLQTAYQATLKFNPVERSDSSVAAALVP